MWKEGIRMSMMKQALHKRAFADPEVSMAIHDQAGPLKQKMYENYVEDAEAGLGSTAIAAGAGLGVGLGVGNARQALDVKHGNVRVEELIEQADLLRAKANGNEIMAAKRMLVPGLKEEYDHYLGQAEQALWDSDHKYHKANRLYESLSPELKLSRTIKRGAIPGGIALLGTAAGLGAYADNKAHHEALQGLGIDASQFEGARGNESYNLPVSIGTGIGGAAGASAGIGVANKLLAAHRSPFGSIATRSIGGLLGASLGGAVGSGVTNAGLIHHDKKQDRLYGDSMPREASSLPDSFFEKEASLLGLLGAATAFHVAPNLAMKAVKSTERGHKALTNTFAAGVNHGKTGQKLHPNIQFGATYGIGPESMVEYNLGHKFGSKLSRYGDDGSEYVMNVLKRNVNTKLDQATPEVKERLMHTPLIGTVKRYLDGQGEGRLNQFLTKRGVPLESKATAAQNAVNVAMIGGAGAVDPHLLFQPAISYARKKTAESPIGAAFLKKNFEQGKAGKQISKGREFLTDMVVSPSMLDPYRVGKSYAEAIPEQVRTVAEPLVKNMHQNIKTNASIFPKKPMKEYLSDEWPSLTPSDKILEKVRSH